MKKILTLGFQDLSFNDWLCSSDGQSTALITLGSVVQFHPQPPIPYFFRQLKIIIIATKPRTPSVPIRLSSSDRFLYTSPTNGASGPKIIPSNRATETIGTNTSVNLVKKSVMEFKNCLYFICKVRRASRPFFINAYLLSKPIRIAATKRPTKPFSPSVETTPRSPSRTSLKNATLPPNTIPATTPKPTTPINSDVRSDTIPLSVSIARIIIPPYQVFYELQLT